MLGFDGLNGIGTSGVSPLGNVGAMAGNGFSSLLGALAGNAYSGDSTQTNYPLNLSFAQQQNANIMANPAAFSGIGSMGGLGGLGSLGGFGAIAGSLGGLQGFAGSNQNGFGGGTSFGGIGPLAGATGQGLLQQSQGGLIPMIITPLMNLFTVLKSLIFIKKTIKETKAPDYSNFTTEYDQYSSYTNEAKGGYFDEVHDYEINDNGVASAYGHPVN